MFISDQNVIAKSNIDRNCIFSSCWESICMLDHFFILKIPLQTDTCIDSLVEIFLKLSTKTAEMHLIIGMTLVHSVISIVFKFLAFLKLEF